MLGRARACAMFAPGKIACTAALLALLAVPAGSSPDVTDCDRYAASDVDPQRTTAGVSFERINPNLAVPACQNAVRQFPDSARLIFQLGRSYDRGKSFIAAFFQYHKAADKGY